MKNGFKFSLSGTVLAVLCFFLPNVLVSCNARPLAEMNGWNLAFGMTVNSGLYSGEEIEGRVVFIVALMSAIVIGILLYMAWKRDWKIEKNWDGFTVIGLSIISLIVYYTAMNGLKQEAIESGLLFEYKVGYYGTLLAYILTGIGGFLNIQASNSDRVRQME